MVSETSLLRWIPLLPLAAAVIHALALGLARKPLSRWSVVLLSCGACVGSFVVTCFAFAALVSVDGEARATRAVED